MILTFPFDIEPIFKRFLLIIHQQNLHNGKTKQNYIYAINFTVKCVWLDFFLSFSRVLHDSTPRYVGPLVGWSVGRSVGQSVGRSVPFLRFRRFWAFWAYGSCPDDLVTFSSTAPAHLHGTRVAVYPALLEEKKDLMIWEGKQ